MWSTHYVSSSSERTSSGCYEKPEKEIKKEEKKKTLPGSLLGWEEKHQAAALGLGSAVAARL